MGPGALIGDILASSSRGIWPWDEADWRGAGRMADTAMSGAAVLFGIILALLLVTLMEVSRVYGKRAVGQDTQVAIILWSAMGAFGTLLLFGAVVIRLSPTYTSEIFFLWSWSALLYILTMEVCDLYAARQTT